MTYSDYSLLSSVCKVESLVEHAVKMGFKALALTDLDITAGHGELEYFSKRAGIKPIFGVTLTALGCGQIVLLALSKSGYTNLLHLTSLGTAISNQDLLNCKEDMALLVDPRITKEHYNWFEDNFGANFYLRHELGQDLDYITVYPEHKFVLCQDVRYFRKSSLVTLEILGKIKGQDVVLPKYPFLSWEGLCQEFKGPKAVIQTTLDLAQRCNVQLPREQILPPQSGGDDLETLVWRGAKKRFGVINDEIKKRLNHELTVICDLGYEDYFLIVADIVGFAKKAKIAVGPGRGSAASSLVAYVLGITDIDPLRWGLLFERFLNAERNKKPDIDLDFCYERRGEVLSYVVNRFGKDYVAQIGTYGTFGSKAATSEVKRILGKENSVVAAEIQGLKRHRSTHAAGIIITARPVQEISAVFLDRDIPVTHLDMYALEDLGVLKIDLLGLRTLTFLQGIETEIKKKEADFSLANIPLTDQQTLQHLGKGRSLGIFQLESDLFQELLQKLRPTCFEDLVALLALGRPGPLSMFPEYVQRRDRQSEISYPHTALAKILGETFGLILYQEQVMLIANQIGGLSLGEADLLRSALAKNVQESLPRWRELFVCGAQDKLSLTKQEAQQLFKMIAQFSGYAFNKAHSVSYAHITWQAAYLKVNYSGEFFINLLNQGNSIKEQQKILVESSFFGLKILPPSVIYSDIAVSLEENKLRLGLTSNRILSLYDAKRIIKGKARMSNLARLRQQITLDETTLEKLILSGALDDLGGRNQHLRKLGLEERSEFELLQLEKELLGIYVSSHPCQPFLPLVHSLQENLIGVAGEIIEFKYADNQLFGLLDTPDGLFYFNGLRKHFENMNMKLKARIAVFYQDEVKWALPLGPTLLITPKPDNLGIIKDILSEENGLKPTILLIGQSYHLLPKQFWVKDPPKIETRLRREQIVYTWFDPWKENV